MALRNSALRYGAVAVALHWTIAALIVTQFVLANLAEQAEDAGSLMGQIAWLARHKSVGITILGLAVVRLLWRLGNAPPPLPAQLPGWQKLAASTTHWIMYALLFALPLSGWTMSSAANFPVSWFDLVRLPDLVGPSEALKDQLVEVHELLATTLFAVTLLHVAAALKHHFVDRDGVLLRMFGIQRAP